MKKIILIMCVTLGMFSIANALQLTSDENGPVTVSEPQLQIGSKAPVVTLVTPSFKKETIGGATGKVQIISTIESFNTSVCDQQTMDLNTVAKKLKDVQITVVTTNQPFVVDTYQKQHKINNIRLLSAFNNPTFGMKYGVQVVGGELTGITARSVFVVNKQGKIVYKQITQNIDHMPNLKAAYAAAEKAVS